MFSIITFIIITTAIYIVFRSSSRSNGITSYSVVCVEFANRWTKQVVHLLARVLARNIAFHNSFSVRLLCRLGKIVRISGFSLFSWEWFTAPWK